MEPFVGRERELAALRTELARAEAGEPRVVLLEGPAGSGKTTLTDRFLEHVPDDTVLLRARAEESEREMPLAALGHLLRPVRVRLPAPLAGVAEAHPEVADPLVLGLALVDALADLGTGAPIVVVVDDAHCADLWSARALAFAVRRLVADRVLVLLAGRSDDGAAVPAPLHRLAEARGAVLALTGLGPDELAELSGALGGHRLPAAKLAALHAQTGGNPLYARAALAADPSLAGVGASTPIPAPQRYADEITARLDSCSARAQRLARALSVLGTAARLPQVAVVAELAEPAAAVDETVRARLVEMRGDGPDASVAFVHPLARAAVYHAMPGAERLALHARAADVVPDRLSQLRHRVLATAVYDDALAAELQAVGKDAATTYGWAVASWAFTAAGRLTRDREAAEKLVLRGVEAAILAGDAALVARQMADVAGFTDSACKSFILGVVAMVSGRPAEAEQLFRAAHDALGDGPDDLELADALDGWLMLLLVNTARVEGEAERAQRVVTRALEGHGTVNIGVATASLWVARLGRDTPGFEELLGELPSTAGEHDLGRTGLLLGRGVARVWAENLPGAWTDLNAVLPVLRRRGPFGDLLVALLYLCDSAYRMGSWDDSVRYGELAVSAAEDGEQEFAYGLVHSAASWALSGRGLWAPAEAYAAAAQRAAAALGDTATRIWSAVSAARLAHARGDPAGVLAALDALQHDPNPLGIRTPTLQPWQGCYAEALLAVGRVDDAEPVVAALEAAAAAPTNVGGRSAADAAWARGLLDEARGRHADAAAGLARAAELAARCDQPFLEACVVASRGEFLLRRNRRAEGAACLARARSIFGSLGAAPYAERASRQLDGSGVPSTPAARDRLALTVQETAVASLVARGLSNREVARELFVSVKTVEYHLSNTYAKLGIRSRTQLTRLLTERDT